MKIVKGIWLILCCVLASYAGTADSQALLFPAGLLQPYEWLDPPVDGYTLGPGPLLLPEDWVNDPVEPALAPPLLSAVLPPPQLESQSVPEPAAWMFVSLGIGLLSIAGLPRRPVRKALTKSSNLRASESADPSAWW